MNEPAPTTRNEDRLVWTVEEAARLPGISRAPTYGLVARDELPHVRLGRRIVVPKHAIEALFARDLVSDRRAHSRLYDRVLAHVNCALLVDADDLTKFPAHRCIDNANLGRRRRDRAGQARLVMESAIETLDNQATSGPMPMT